MVKDGGLDIRPDLDNIYYDKIDLAPYLKTGENTIAATKIEAETYFSSSGVISESCSEGTLNVGSIETGDWMAYSNIVVPQTGTYRVEYRVASLNGGGKLTMDINAGSVVLDTVDIPYTGGWQNWQTISGTFYLTKGTYNFGHYAQTGGWNINWFAFTPVDATAVASTNANVRAGERSLQVAVK